MCNLGFEKFAGEFWARGLDEQVSCDSLIRNLGSMLGSPRWD